MRDSNRRDKHFLKLQPSALWPAVSPHLGQATYLPIWNTTPLNLDSGVDTCFLCSVSKPRDLFLLASFSPTLLPKKSPLHLFFSRLYSTLLPAVFCWGAWTNGVSLVSVAKSPTQPLKPPWKAGSRSPLHAATAGQLPLPELSCEASSGSRVWGDTCRVSWVAITWSLLIFCVLSIPQQEKCRSSVRSLKGARQRQWACMRGCWAGWSCSSATKIVFSSVTDVCELELSQRYNLQKYILYVLFEDSLKSSLQYVYLCFLPVSGVAF